MCPDDRDAGSFAAFLINQLIRCLLWADDLLLFSRKVTHIQRQIDALERYCIRNKLCVNRSKTKVIYVHAGSDGSAHNQHVFTYGGTPLENVNSYKYVGVWLDSKGTCEVQAKEVLAKANKAMYMCMSKVRHISSNCPPLLRSTLFRAYVSTHFTYCCEVVPYTRKHISNMNDIVYRYAKWATGLPRNACRNSVLREAGLRPVHYDFLQARMNYYLLLLSRNESHVTRAALADLKERVHTSAYSKWYKGIVNSFSKLSCQATD